MFNDFYELSGNITIPKDKKQEFNDLVLKLLDRCGVRCTREVDIDGSKVTVAERIHPDKEGIVRYNYSVYETTERNDSFYDTNTCLLTVNNPGFMVMGLAMILVMVLTESYSETPCYLVLEGKMRNINYYAHLVEEMLGIELRFPHRRDLWQIYTYTKEHDRLKTLAWVDIGIQVPEDFEGMEKDLWMYLLLINKGTINPVVESNLTKAQIKDGELWERIETIYTIYKELSDNGKPVEAYIKQLLTASLDERTALSLEDSALGMLAEFSKYMPAQALVIIYALSKDADFWELWEDLSVNGYYRERIGYTGPEPMPVTKHKDAIRFCEAALNDAYDDKSLGEFSNRELSLSTEMLKTIADWKDLAASPKAIENNCKDLKKLLFDLTDSSIRKMDYDLFTELTNNPDKNSTKKALYLLRVMADDGIDKFPELTREQARKWVLKYSRGENYKKKVNCLIGLLSNKDKRLELLGF